MNAFIGSILPASATRVGADLLLATATKSFLLLAVTLTVLLVWRRAAAATRHFILLAGLTSLLVLPFVSLLTPAWASPTWAGKGFMEWTGNILPSASSTLARSPAFSDANHSGTAAKINQPRAETDSQVPTRLRQLDARNCLILVWAAGAGIVLLRFSYAWFRLGSIGRKSRILNSPKFAALLETVKAGLSLKRPVRIIQSANPSMPATWGTRRPVVLLPCDVESWEPERLQLVLRHELAHVKRRDCLAQNFANLAWALYWFNPLVWLAKKMMCLERERACDDLVLSAGAQPVDYAGHLLEIARQFASSPRTGAIAMARQSSLEKRLRTIVDASRKPGRLRPATTFIIVLIMGGLTWYAGGKSQTVAAGEAESASLRQKQIAQLQSFAVAKERQSQALAAKAGEQISPEFRKFFDAAIQGDSQTVTNMYADFKRRHPQYQNGTNADLACRKSYWSPVLEICLACFDVVTGEPKYTQGFVDDVIGSIPTGAIYFGGTDPGRGLITAFSKAHADGDPFFTVTQNALADGTYLDYLRNMYGGKIYIPTDAESQEMYAQYLADTEKRLRHDQQFPSELKQIKPGEDVHLDAGKVQVSGQVAVMAINALLARVVFDKNPGREFYIEESYPLDWMYPYLEPHGLILKINRQPLAELTPEMIQTDRAFWHTRMAGIIGDWLNEETPVKTLADFVQKVYVRHDLDGFTGDRGFVQNENAGKLYAKLRCSIGGLYNWHLKKAKTPAEKQRYLNAADFAFRQAFALCPISTESIFRYVELLMAQNRMDDALLIASTSVQIPSMDASSRQQVESLVAQLKIIQKQSATGSPGF
jgi:beta-lactamase regulating signal transducer with metallopeptidase domain